MTQWNQMGHKWMYSKFFMLFFLNETWLKLITCELVCPRRYVSVWTLTLNQGSSGPVHEGRCPEMFTCVSAPNPEHIMQLLLPPVNTSLSELRCSSTQSWFLHPSPTHTAPPPPPLVIRFVAQLSLHMSELISNHLLRSRQNVKPIPYVPPSSCPAIPKSQEKSLFVMRV